MPKTLYNYEGKALTLSELITKAKAKEIRVEYRKLSGEYKPVLQYDIIMPEGYSYSITEMGYLSEAAKGLEDTSCNVALGIYYERKAKNAMKSLAFGHRTEFIRGAHSKGLGKHEYWMHVAEALHKAGRIRKMRPIYS